MPGTRKKDGKSREVSKASKTSKASRRKKLTTPKRYAPVPITEAARLFLYECPGGMEENERRDKFLKSAEMVERTGGNAENVLENVVRAGFFQGTAYAKASAVADATQHGSRGKKRGALDAAENHVIFTLLEEIGVGIAERLGVHDDNEDEHVDTLINALKTLDERFDHEEGDADHWKDQLNQLSSDILDCVLGRARERLERLMGASAWKEMGLPSL